MVNFMLYIFRASGKHKTIYTQQVAHVKNRKHSYKFRLLSIAIFREYQYLKMHTDLSYVMVKYIDAAVKHLCAMLCKHYVKIIYYKTVIDIFCSRTFRNISSNEIEWSFLHVATLCLHKESSLQNYVNVAFLA
jgi:hypothetical protein